MILLFLLSLCWNRCAENDTDKTSASAQNKKDTVVVQEIKPGIIVIQGGTSDEQIRIIQEYETIRMQQQQHQQPIQQMNYGATRQVHLQQAAAPQQAPPYPSMPPPPPMAHGAATADPFQLIDFDPDTNARPPPYAPHKW